MSIVEELRNKTSRDNRELLNRAALEIEDLEKNLEGAYAKIETLQAEADKWHERCVEMHSIAEAKSKELTELKQKYTGNKHHGGKHMIISKKKYYKQLCDEISQEERDRCIYEKIDLLIRKFQDLERKYELATAEREANVKGFTEELENIRYKVASEIFDDLDGLTYIMAKGDMGELDFYGMVDQLKKKYLGGE